MKKISIKTFYLIAVISIGLIGLAVGSTYAMFTTSAEINNPITISSNLISNDDVMETFEVEVKSKEFITKTIIVNSGNNTNINYGIWYLNDITDIEIGIKSTTNNEISGTITNSNTSRTIEIAIKNKSTEKKTITIGVATSKNSIILASNMSLIPKKVVENSVPLSTTITNLYNNSTKTPVTNNSITYQYDTTHSLMKDTAGNIRYYGASPNNYIYFNCSDYSNQSSSTCETWRIIGVFDGKVKIMRNEVIGDYSWNSEADSTDSSTSLSNNNDNTNIVSLLVNEDINYKTIFLVPVLPSEPSEANNNWSQSSLMKLLNPGYESKDIGGSLYYNSGSGSCYSGQNNATTTCDFTSTGIKNDTTRNLISETLYYLGGWNTSQIYSDQIYGYERGTTVYSGRPTTWTGKIALPYPSDYGYAADLGSCTQTLWNYDNSTCTSANWMKSIFTSSYNWLLTPNSGDSYNAWRVGSSGDVLYSIYSSDGVYYFSGTSNAYGVAPVLYLSSELGIGSGTGTGSSSAPYQLLV